MVDRQSKSFLLLVLISSILVSSFFGFLAGLSVVQTAGAGAVGFQWPSLEQLRQKFFPSPSPSQLSPGESGKEKFSPLLPASPSPVPREAIGYEEQIISVVKRSSPAVVSIIISKNLPVLEQYFENPFKDFGIEIPFEFGIPRYREKGTKKQEVGGGSGFFVSEDGLLVTNKHVVVDTEAEYTVLMNDGSRYDAKVLARDPVLDLAILKISKRDLPTLPLGDSDKIEIGQTAIAIGNALGEFRNTVSVGVISGISRTIKATGEGIGTETLSNVIQTDAAINRGNSGGPLLNLRGEVIGVNTAMALGAENIGFAIPINQVKQAILQVQKTGKISVPFLGVRYRLINEALQKEKNLPSDHGAWVISDGENLSVTPGSPAAKAGIREGDIILEVNGEKITTENPLANIIRKYNVGDTITLKVLREGKEITLKATLAERN